MHIYMSVGVQKATEETFSDGGSGHGSAMTVEIFFSVCPSLYLNCD